MAASIISELAQRKVATGLFSQGTVSGKTHCVPAERIAWRAPDDARSARGASSPLRNMRFPEILSAESGRLQRGTSVVAVATDFPEAALVAIAELRRRHAVTAVWVETERGSPPPSDSVDALLSARYSDDWQRREVLELAL